MNKVLYCIRHGQAIHNKLFHIMGVNAYRQFRDTNLLVEGKEEAKKLRQQWTKIKDIELVIASPCDRTLETAVLIFRSKPIIALDCLIEYPMGGTDICNHRIDRTELEILYPYVDFSQLTQNVLPWMGENESIDDLNDRIQSMLHWIQEREEKNIAIVGHSSFLGQFMNNEIGDEQNELKHCHPYKIPFKKR